MFTRSIVIAVILFTAYYSAATDKKATVYEIRQGRNLEAVLSSAGFTLAEARSLLRQPIIPKHFSMMPKDKYLVNRPSNDRFELKIYRPFGDNCLVFWKNKDEVGVEQRVIKFRTEIQNIEGIISGSLIQSIQRYVPGEWGHMRFSDAFAYDIRFGKTLQKGDSFKFAIEKKYDEGELVKYGDILRAELVTGQKEYRRVYWKTKSGGFFADVNSNYSDRPFFAPVGFLHISSYYTKRRFHPIKRRYQPHLGVDFAADIGQPILAARTGVIDQMNHHRANGYFVRIKHDGGFYTWYNHLSRWEPKNFIGKEIRVGEVIGYMGCSGYCTNPHLDFRVMKGNKLYDPLPLMKPFPYSERDYYKTSDFRSLANALVAAFD